MAKHQCSPTDDDLKTWLLLGGRGSGKTFAGSVWIDIMARELPGITLAAPIDGTALFGGSFAGGLMFDSVHPNAAGQARIAEAVRARMMI